MAGVGVRTWASPQSLASRPSCSASAHGRRAAARSTRKASRSSAAAPAEEDPCSGLIGAIHADEEIDGVRSFKKVSRRDYALHRLVRTLCRAVLVQVRRDTT